MEGSRFAILTDAQLAAELARCEYCEEKPCKAACPADCSPADFIMAVRVGEPSDYRRAAALILGKNPFGGVCGAVCPERHCQHGCVRTELDRAIDIPAVQATIIAKARALGIVPELTHAPATGQRIAVLGAGPAGYGAAAVLAQVGHAVEILETADRDGGMAALIPEYRLDPSVLDAEPRVRPCSGRHHRHSRSGSPDP